MTRAKAGLAARMRSWVKRNASVLRLQRANRQLRRQVAEQADQLVALRAQVADGYNGGIRAAFESVSTEAFTPATTPPAVNVLENSISAAIGGQFDSRLDAQREAVPEAEDSDGESWSARTLPKGWLR